ncbi:Nramp family divalent metal transporter, partial [Patescibacteria group bacterium]|nr:Nramp family divalent metal transporter [Patescibacteria group bacterium]
MPARSKNLPTPPGMFSTLGPSFILLGLALGSGELIMWPYLAANYGLGILWGGLLGITFQFVLNTETMRYTLAWGESVFVGFRKLSVIIPLWYIISTFIPWSLPGFSSASSQILSNYVNFPHAEAVIAVGLLLITGIILSAGKFLYNTM